MRRNRNPDLDPAGGAPVVLFEEFDESALVLSPLDNFMTAVGGEVAWCWNGGREGVRGGRFMCVFCKRTRHTCSTAVHMFCF